MNGVPDRAAAILADVAAEHGVTVAEIIGPSRKPKIAYARFHAEAALRALTMANGAPPSYPMIGRWLGGRDHTTIIHGCARWAQIAA
jgi:chromosomal replication initiator protein